MTSLPESVHCACDGRLVDGRHGQLVSRSVVPIVLKEQVSVAVRQEVIFMALLHLCLVHVVDLL